MPSLIAGASALKIGYKEVAGVFAYMTGKGQSAERASVLMTNMFSQFGKKDVVDKLAKAGISIFDKKTGEMRGMVDIFTDYNRVMGSMTGYDAMSLLDKVGIVDKEAKASFGVMAADVAKLSSTMGDCRNAIGETDRALELSTNTTQRVAELWSSFKGKMVDLGTAVLPLVEGGIVILGAALTVVSATVGGVYSMFGWWFDQIENGNPLIWALTSALGAAGAMLLVHKGRLVAVSLWNSITAISSGALTSALKIANAAMLTSPWGWALMGVMALVAGIAALMSKTDGATRSFAEFNVELNKTKNETEKNFAAATTATQGSVERAAAIKKINEQYGEYLPALLNEQSSNNDLAIALSTVNTQLEQKIKLKFYDRKMEGLMQQIDDAKTEAMDYILNQVPEEQRVEVAKAATAAFARMESGASTWEKEAAIFSAKYGIGTGVWQTLGGGFTSDLTTFSATGGVLRDFQQVAYETGQAKVLAGIQYGVKQQSTPQPKAGNGGSFVNGKYVPSYSISLKTGNEPTNLISVTPTPVAPIVPTVNTTSILGGTKGKANGNDWTNLDKIEAANVKGSSTYGAIMSKIGHVKMAGLAAASVVGMSLSTPMPGTSIDAPQESTLTADNGTYGSFDKEKPQMAKFCDNLVINIANTDGRGEQEIRSTVIQVMTEVTEQYNG